MHAEEKESADLHGGRQSLSRPTHVTFFVVVVRFKPFPSIQTIAGLWDIGNGGDSGPGRNGRRPGKTHTKLARATPSALSSHRLAPLRPAAVTIRRGGATPGPSLGTSGRHPSCPENIGHRRIGDEYR